jgi:hypothetical protein
VSDNLSHFLVDLASNPDQMRAYLADPARVLESASLNADERAAMLSCDSAKIRDVLHAGPGDPTGESKAGKKKKKKGSKTKKSKKSIKKK